MLILDYGVTVERFHPALVLVTPHSSGEATVVWLRHALCSWVSGHGLTTSFQWRHK
jgi:hypothetical protein